MVTKETGKNGGYDEKIRAARRNGASVIVIRREKENGFSVKEVEEKILPSRTAGKQIFLKNRKIQFRRRNLFMWF